ncbi:hypothetical protein [Paenibacillus xylanexedens]|uniref:hypothetical protein n=1 Tax=Paenibacillus xylanexedens TaxID=528191 RepID=UPI0011A8B258|nr:hypothetical protein [Paenibacillus xylanexedens]
MKYEFKGIVRGTFSQYQTFGCVENPVVVLSSNDLHEMLDGLALDEFVFVLKTNGRRIKDPVRYINRLGLNFRNYTREGANEYEQTSVA